MVEEKFEEARHWYLKAIKETEEPAKLARVHAGLSITLFYLRKPGNEILEEFEKACNFDSAQVLADSAACRTAVLTLLSQDKLKHAKYILEMQEKHIESIENNDDFIEAKKAVIQYENKLKMASEK